MVRRPIRTEESFERPRDLAVDGGHRHRRGARAFPPCSARDSCWAWAKRARFPLPAAPCRRGLRNPSAAAFRASCTSSAGSPWPSRRWFPGSILLALGWRWIFYIFGSMGILWSVVFFTIFRNHPEDHPGVNQAELAEIRGLNADGTIKALDRSRPRLHGKHTWVAEHVVHRARLRLFLLRIEFLSDVVSHVLARVPAPFDPIAGIARIAAVVYWHDGRRGGRMAHGQDLSQDRKCEVGAARGCRSGICPGRPVFDSRRDDHRHAHLSVCSLPLRSFRWRW